jgi:hypothetical protein
MNDKMVDPQFIANIQNDDANRLGITQSNIDRFLQIGRDSYTKRF